MLLEIGVCFVEGRGADGELEQILLDVLCLPLALETLTQILSQLIGFVELIQQLPLHIIEPLSLIRNLSGILHLVLHILPHFLSDLLSAQLLREVGL